MKTNTNFRSYHAQWAILLILFCVLEECGNCVAESNENHAVSNPAV